MSIATELQKYNDGLLDAYSAVSTKGGTVPANKNLDNLPTAINSISGGGGGALDPEQGYRETRPADWLVMPELDPDGADVAYLLVHIPSSTTENVYFNLGAALSSSGSITWEFGLTDSDGVFSPIPSLTVQKSYVNTAVYSDTTLPLSAFGAATADGQLQLICKITTSGPRFGTFYDHSVPSSLALYGLVKEVQVVATATTYNIQFGNNSVYPAINYVSWVGADNRISFNSMFAYCQALIAVLELDASSGTDFQSMFQACSSLVAIPQLDMSSGTTFQSMFQMCYSLKGVPQLTTTNGTSFQNMFQTCYSLESVPLLDTANGTTFQGMFQNCYNLTSVPQLDTSSGNIFQSMFQGCYALSEVPQLDTSSGTDFSSMFQNCSSLPEIPLLNTSNGTSFKSMFQGCHSLKSVPLLNTANGTNFQQMFSNCASLISVPLLDTSKGTNFSSMFGYCYSLKAIPHIDTSTGTNFTNFVSYCPSLIDLDFSWLDMSAVTSNYNVAGVWNYVMYGGKPTLVIGDKWPAAGIPGSSNITNLQAGNFATVDYPVHIKINKTNAKLSIATNATTLFTAAQYLYVHVPDALLATYQADTKWATLGARLKGYSALPS